MRLFVVCGAIAALALGGLGPARAAQSAGQARVPRSIVSAAHTGWSPSQVALTPETGGPTGKPIPTATFTAVPTATGVPKPTSTPKPTATPAHAAPSARKLLAQARAAVKAANTSSFDLREKLNLFSFVSGEVRLQGVMSQRPAAMSAHMTGNLLALGKPEKVDEYHTQIGKNAWVKSAKTHHLWRTEKPGSSQDQTLVVNPLDAATGAGGKILTLKTVGVERFGGVKVWHVYGTVLLPLSGKTTTKGTVDFLISQKGRLPYRVAEYVNDKKDDVMVTMTDTMSHFGERVSITAPKVGSTFSE